MLNITHYLKAVRKIGQRYEENELRKGMSTLDLIRETEDKQESFLRNEFPPVTLPQVFTVSINAVHHEQTIFSGTVDINQDINTNPELIGKTIRVVRKWSNGYYQVVGNNRVLKIKNHNGLFSNFIRD